MSPYSCTEHTHYQSRIYFVAACTIKNRQLAGTNVIWQRSLSSLEFYWYVTRCHAKTAFRAVNNNLYRFVDDCSS